MIFYSPPVTELIRFHQHPISLLKEYKREVVRYIRGERSDYPPYPDNYFSLRSEAILERDIKKAYYSYMS